MKRTWITIGIIGGLGILAVIGANVYTVATQISYEIISYQVQLLDASGITLRFFIALTNPTTKNIDIWDQRYDVFVAGYKFSTVTSTDPVRILARNTSVIPLDITLNWQELDTNLSAFLSQSSTSSLGDLPLTIKGSLGAKLGILKLSRFPVRASTVLGKFLP